MAYKLDGTVLVETSIGDPAPLPQTVEACATYIERHFQARLGELFESRQEMEQSVRNKLSLCLHSIGMGIVYPEVNLEHQRETLWGPVWETTGCLADPNEIRARIRQLGMMGPGVIRLDATVFKE